MKMQDNTIDQKTLSNYAYLLSFNSECTQESPQNRTFWELIEQNFIHSYLEQTEASYDFKINLPTLRAYVYAIKNLNKETTCTLGHQSSPAHMLSIIKRSFLRHKTIQVNQIKHYIQIFTCITQSKNFKRIYDDQIIDKVIDLIVTQKQDFNVLLFRAYCMGAMTMKVNSKHLSYQDYLTTYREMFAQFVD